MTGGVSTLLVLAFLPGPAVRGREPNPACRGVVLHWGRKIDDALFGVSVPGLLLGKRTVFPDHTRNRWVAIAKPRGSPRWTSRLTGHLGTSDLP